MNFEFAKGSRSRILAVGLLAITVLFVGRLFYVQIIRHDYYQNLADQEQIKRLTIPAQRGLIYAMDGSTPVPLVMNDSVYTMFADPTTVTDIPGVIKEIDQVVGASNAQPNLDSLMREKNSRYEVLAKNLTTDQAEAIKKKDFAGIGFQQQSQRTYPEGALAAQVLGFVDSSGNGEYGVEGELNTQLKGKDGLLQSVTDVSDVPLTIGKHNISKPAINGTNEVLTIDRNIQSYAEQALAQGLKASANATDGSVLVMDPENGHVLAMANLPSFDPSHYGDASSLADFNNPIISDPYEPGSDVKTLTMATGVDKGVVTPDTTYNNTGSINVDGVNVSNAEGDKEFGDITLQTALNFSLNTGFITVAEKLGDGQNITKQARDTMYDYFYNKFKLGQVTGIQLAGETPGIVISPESVQGNAVRYSNMSFGQGLDVTMIQVASAFNSLINGGNYFKPTILAGTIDSNGNFQPAKQGGSVTSVKATTSATLRTMIHAARQSVASIAAKDKPGYYIGGKTGTSQQVVNGTYSDKLTTATYLGFGGTKETSKYVIMVRVTGPNFSGSGAQDAIPIFTNISNWLLGYLNVPPENS